MHSCPFLAAQSPEKRDIGLLVNMLSVQYMKDLCKGPTQPPALNPVPPSETPASMQHIS